MGWGGAQPHRQGSFGVGWVLGHRNAGRHKAGSVHLHETGQKPACRRARRRMPTIHSAGRPLAIFPLKRWSAAELFLQAWTHRSVAPGMSMARCDLQHGHPRSPLLGAHKIAFTATRRRVADDPLRGRLRSGGFRSQRNPKEPLSREDLHAGAFSFRPGLGSPPRTSNWKLWCT